MRLYCGTFGCVTLICFTNDSYCVLSSWKEMVYSLQVQLKLYTWQKVLRRKFSLFALMQRKQMERNWIKTLSVNYYVFLNRFS